MLNDQIIKFKKVDLIFFKDFNSSGMYFIRSVQDIPKFEIKVLVKVDD